MNDIAPRKASFKEQQLIVREHAILDSVNHLLASKGFDLMTMDEVAADVGIAKASLYKHFQSKEELAAAAMARLLESALAAITGFAPALAALDKLKATVRWCVQTHLSGNMPMLPSTRSSIRQVLTGYAPYMERLARVSEILGGWIADAQAKGALSSRLPAEAILYTLFARSCDPVADFLQESGAYDNDQIVDYLVTACFEGIQS
jgi:TetR/AcrR family transcriptional regulator, regulator of autoinduction and epiphytic fitness